MRTHPFHRPCLLRHGAASVVLLLTLFAVSTASAPALAAEPEAIHDRWFRVLMEGQPSGWAHERVLRTPGGERYTTVMDMQLAIRRGPVEVEIAVTSSFDESNDHEPLSAVLDQDLGLMRMTQRIDFDGRTQAEIISTQYGQETRRNVDIEGGDEGWLTPRQQGALALRKLRDGVESYSYRAVDPTSGARVVEVQRQRVGEETLEIEGETIETTVWEERSSAAPGVVGRLNLDDQARTVRSSAQLMPGMTLTLVQASEAEATGEVAPAEVMVSTLVEPSRPLPQPRKLRRAVYRVSFSDNEMDARGDRPDLPTTGYQRVVAEGEATRVEVDLDKPAAAAARASLDAAYLEASTMINGGDPVVRRLAEVALAGAGELTPRQKVDRLCLFAADTIAAKDLSVGFATASEVARTKQGDCTEHAVLLAALLRAEGIPGRVVWGLVYVEEFLGQQGVFGYHMWTQAWLPDGEGDRGRWVDLDPTLGLLGIYDAGHIALGTSALRDGDAAMDIASLLPLFSMLNIEVVEPK